MSVEGEKQEKVAIYMKEGEHCDRLMESEGGVINGRMKEDEGGRRQRRKEEG